MGICYILHSVKLDRYYIGVTNDSVEDRILKHNTVKYGKHRFTAKANDWSLFLAIKADDYTHAVRMERKIKAMKSSKYIKNLLNFPELLNSLIESTKSI